jgi:hypothetical protein
MPPATSYTESTLADFMLDEIGQMATILSWSDLSDVQAAVNRAIRAYGVAAIASATDMDKLEALARVAIWQRVADYTVAAIKVSSDGASFDRQQIHEHATEKLKAAQAEALAYDSAYEVGVDRLKFIHDPYEVIDEDDRDL